MKLAIRGFRQGELFFEERIDVPEEQLDQIIPSLAEKHAEALRDEPHMIEIEFLEETNPNERFFRFGTDPTGMVLPVELNLDANE